MIDYDDQELLARLRAAALVADAVPPHVVEAARAVFGLRDLDAALATLISDSAEADRSADLVLLRGPEEPRTVTFEEDGVTVDIEIAEADGRLRIVGIATGVRPGDLTVEYDDGTSVTTAVDELGRFAADVPGGRARLRFRRSEGGAVVTQFTSF